jgi:hypothetical protein
LLQRAPGGYTIWSHHKTALTTKGQYIFASKAEIDGPPLTVSFVPVPEPAIGVTRFEKRSNDACLVGVSKRRKAASADGVASSPASASPTPPPKAVRVAALEETQSPVTRQSVLDGVAFLATSMSEQEKTQFSGMLSAQLFCGGA